LVSEKKGEINICDLQNFSVVAYYGVINLEVKVQIIEDFNKDAIDLDSANFPIFLDSKL
jgi:hypothetical protein